MEVEVINQKICSAETLAKVKAVLAVVKELHLNCIRKIFQWQEKQVQLQ
jgi:hypothetical protein